LLTILIYFLLLTALKKENKKFIQAFYLTTIIRLFGSIVILMIYLFFNRQNLMEDAVVFLILYFLYTGFEIVNLFPTLRPEIKESQN